MRNHAFWSVIKNPRPGTKSLDFAENRIAEKSLRYRPQRNQESGTPGAREAAFGILPLDIDPRRLERNGVRIRR